MTDFAQRARKAEKMHHELGPVHPVTLSPPCGDTKARARQIVNSPGCRSSVLLNDEGPVQWIHKAEGYCFYCRMKRQDAAIATYVLYDHRPVLERPELEKYRARLMLEGVLTGQEMYEAFGGLSPAEAISALRGENVADDRIAALLFAACERGLPVDQATQIALDNKLVDPE